MRTENILLSVLIPTYKRPRFLETTVECFKKQIKAGGLEDTVEIILSNDASKDDTETYVNHISGQYPYLRGFNQQENLGLSQNIEFLVKEAKGEYILICGEDDLVRDGALEYFIKCIKDLGPNFILVNTSNIISNDNANRDYKIILENRLKIETDIFIKNFDSDHKKLDVAFNWLHLTNLLPAVIFKKELFVREMATAKKYLRPENLWLWQGPILIGISKYGKFLVIANSYVLHRKNESHWTNATYGVVFFNIFDNAEVANLIKVYMPTEHKKYKKLYAAFIMGGLLLATESGKNIRKLAWDAMSKNLDCFPENFQFLSMVIAPKFITKISPKLRKYKSYF